MNQIKIIMKKTSIYLIMTMSMLVLFACKPKNEQSTSKISTHVTTKEEQHSLSPEQVLQEFIEGNNRFNSRDITQHFHNEEIRKKVTDGQFPKAMVLSCVDSRVPVEDVFDQNLGDVFVGRVAGNFINTDLLGSMEFACKVSGAKLIIVMGHQHCGAVKGAIDNVKLGNITSMLENIKPAVAMSQDFEGEKSTKNEAYVKYVAKNNIKNALNEIRSKSPILKEMEEKGEIKIVGAFYTLRTGKMEFVE